MLWRSSNTAAPTVFAAHSDDTLETVDVPAWETSMQAVPFLTWALSHPASLLIGAPPIKHIDPRDSTSHALHDVVQNHALWPVTHRKVMGELVLSAHLRNVAGVKGTLSTQDGHIAKKHIEAFRNGFVEPPGWTDEDRMELNSACETAISAIEERTLKDEDYRREEEARASGKAGRGTLSRLWSKSADDDWSEALKAWVSVLRKGSL